MADFQLLSASADTPLLCRLCNEKYLVHKLYVDACMHKLSELSM